MKQILIVRKILNAVTLQKDIHDYDKIHESIKQNITFKGTNLWILVFAILVASVGLNMNSTAVIIGAMLISPLMGPINGLGYSIATYDFQLFRKAMRHFSFAVLASLLASTTYFAISPISTAHSELLARITPTIYDVLIALFGGLAGIVAISSKHKGNVIPGVAIATALMPPLCTAGYGLATAQWNYFFGAFYLFTINAVFIGISTVVVSQLLKFPIRTLVDDAQRKRVNRWISIVILLVLIPSIYFGYKLVLKEKFVGSATAYIETISVVEGNYLLSNEINPEQRSIRLVYGGPKLNAAQKDRIRKKAEEFSLSSAKIDFMQGLSFEAITKKSSEIDKLKGEINRVTLQLLEQKNYNDSLRARNLTGRQLLDEINTLYPQISKCSFSDSFVFQDSVSAPEKLSIIVLTAKEKSLSNNEREKILNWMQTRLKPNKIKVFYESQ